MWKAFISKSLPKVVTCYRFLLAQPGLEKILISDFSGFCSSLDNGGYSQQSPKTLPTTRETINRFHFIQEWRSVMLNWLTFQIKFGLKLLSALRHTWRSLERVLEVTMCWLKASAQVWSNQSATVWTVCSFNISHKCHQNNKMSSKCHQNNKLPSLHCQWSSWLIYIKCSKPIHSPI